MKNKCLTFHVISVTRNINTQPTQNACAVVLVRLQLSICLHSARLPFVLFFNFFL